MELEKPKPPSWDNLSYPALCACLKKVLQDSGLTALELSEKIDKRYATIVDLLNGKLPNPQLDTIEAVCGALGLSLSFELRPDIRKKPGRRARNKQAGNKEKGPGE